MKWHGGDEILRPWMGLHQSKAMNISGLIRKNADIWQTTFSSLDIVVIWVQFHSILFLGIENKSALFQIMVWPRATAIPYLNQRWSSMRYLASKCQFMYVLHMFIYDEPLVHVSDWFLYYVFIKECRQYMIHIYDIHLIWMLLIIHTTN